MQPISLERQTKDYLYNLNLHSTFDEDRFISIETLIKANIAFKAKFENFELFIDYLSGDRWFARWIQETEDLLVQSE